MRIVSHFPRCVAIVVLTTSAVLCRAETSEPVGQPVAAATESPAIVGLALYPPQVALDHADDYQGVIAVATQADGVTLDVTDKVSWVLAPDAPAKLDGTTLRPVANGNATVKATHAGHEAAIEVTVAGADQHPAISFRHDVMPVFMRGGCNAGGCHGSARGKDGFRLSLFGFDPEGDHFRLTREQAVRRINVTVPEDSLLLAKITNEVPHTGGKQFERGSVYYETLRKWIAAGAVNDVSTAPTITSVTIYPPRAVLEGEGATQKFIAVALYSTGVTRDVTNMAAFLTNNESSALVNADGLVTAGQRGEAFVMARFDTHTVGSQVLALPAGQPFTPAEEKPVNYIDELVAKKLNTLRINPSPICSDEEFLRRVNLDIVGRTPTRAEYELFLADTDPAKRASKIDELLARKEFAEIWAMKWSELLMVKSIPNRVEYKPMFLYSQWLTRQIAGGVPLDEMVRNLLGANGGSFSSPAVNFYQIEETTQETAENVAQVFLGIRMQCAQCHNHPFDRWTMDDYYAFTAFFSQIGRKQGEDYRETIVFDRREGEVNHLVGGRVMKPKFLGGTEPEIKDRDRRAELADWITAPDNPYFAVNVSNRVWAHFFGVGIVEPVDDVRVSNPPSNPDLFAELGKRLKDYKYDLRQLVRDICNSNTYQRSSTPNDTNATDQLNFARAGIRRIPAEMLLDTLCQVTGAQEKFPGLPLGAGAVQIGDGGTSTYFLTTFGRAPRATVCACEAKAEPTLSQALHLLNGGAVHNKIEQGKVIEQLLDAGKKPAEAIDDIYIRCLSRKPTAEESQELLAMCGDNPRPVAELQDIFWAVLNSREFLFNR
ncbi:MAG: DUF1549 domain-containing protein [Pirellulales bacterium]